MAFRSFIKSAARSAVKALGFGKAPQVNPTAERDNLEHFACVICSTPRKLTSSEASQLMALATNYSANSRALARTALYNAAFFSGRHTGPKVTMEPRLRKASTARLAFWATDRGTPV